MKVGRHEVALSNREKVLFPAARLTKGDLVDYYARIAETLLPHIEDRALTLHRFPDGIDAAGFYQQNASDYFPGWIPRARLGKGGETTAHAVCNDAATLVYLANQAVITPHVWLSRTDRPDHPDRMIFDLDPADEDFGTVRSAARALHEVLDALDLASFLMTTGSRGLHVVVPLDRTSGFDAVREFSRTLADRVAANSPDKFTTEQRKNKRAGRLFLDTTRNAYGQTAVAPYAVRAKPGAPIATPLDWKELDDARLTANRYTMKNIFRRLKQRDDPWRSIRRHAVKLEAHRKRLEKL